MNRLQETRANRIFVGILCLFTAIVRAIKGETIFGIFSICSVVALLLVIVTANLEKGKKLFLPVSVVAYALIYFVGLNISGVRELPTAVVVVMVSMLYQNRKFVGAMNIVYLIDSIFYVQFVAKGGAKEASISMVFTPLLMCLIFAQLTIWCLVKQNTENMCEIAEAARHDQDRARKLKNEAKGVVQEVNTLKENLQNVKEATSISDENMKSIGEGNEVTVGAATRLTEMAGEIQEVIVHTNDTVSTVDTYIDQLAKAFDKNAGVLTRIVDPEKQSMQTGENMKNIKACDLKKEYNIIDLRTKGAYMKGHIYNARNIDMNNLTDMPHMYLDKNETYYIYCTEGFKSKRCCKFLEIMGYDVVNVIDGYEGFI